MTGARTLVLVAAGGLAREVVATARAGGRDDLLLVDDDDRLWGTTLAGVPVIGGVGLVSELEDADVVVCVGRGDRRRDVVARLARLGVGPARFPTVVHPSVEVPDGCRVGAGSVLLAQVVLTADVQVGRHVVAMPHVTLTHDVVLDDYATVCAGVSLGGGVVVGEAAYVGMNACVREGLAVAEGSVLGMGAVLTRSLPAGETWTGVPARPLVRDAAGAA